MRFDTILIIGCGLIGSSIARAAKHYDQASKIYVADHDHAVCMAAERLGFADGVAEGSAHHYAAQADLVILCVPPGKIVQAAQQIIPSMKSGAILTDVASIKADITKHIQPLLDKDIIFIPGHPIAGTEFNGPEAGFAELFQDRWCILTPETAQIDTVAVKSLTKFWQALGSNVSLMSPQRHDLVLATTSHVPHLIAYTLVGTAIDMETVTRHEVVKFSAGGFRDFTRIAASDPVMWRDVFLANKEASLEVVERFIEDLTALKRAIRWGEGEVLLEQFAKTRDIRRRIIDAGQDVAEPNFGREDN